MYFALFSLFAILAVSQPADPPSTGGNATRLVELINNYRTSQGATAIPISRALMHVGQRHADAISANTNIVNATCNEFSWPPSPQGSNFSWIACCYNGTNQASTDCMSQKAAQITNGWANPYTGPIFETFGSLNGTFQDYETQLVTIWTNQSSIVNLIMANGTFAAAGPWGAIGAGIALSGDVRRAYLVFGKAADTNGTTPTNNTPSTPTPDQNSTTIIDPISPSGGDPERLIALINEFRVSQQLNACNISRALMYTAQYHASAIARNQSAAINDSCNVFSWPEPLTEGLWQACCYTADNTNSECMSQKPTEITRNWTIPYASETAAETSATLTGDFADPETAILNTWENNTGIRDFLLGAGQYSGRSWNSIGAGIARVTNRTFVYLWFSEETDQNTWMGFPNGTTPTNSTPTPTNTTPTPGSGVPTPTEGTPTHVFVPTPAGNTPTLNPNPTPSSPSNTPSSTPTTGPSTTDQSPTNQNPSFSSGLTNYNQLFMWAIILAIAVVLFI